MKKHILSNWQWFMLPILTALVSLLFLLLIIPKATPLLGTGMEQKNPSANKEVIHYVAIGDSLTEGIGDLTNSGGFVPLVATDLKEQYNLNGVEIDNFGKNGDRSDQILKRIKKQKEIQKSLQSADIITITVGGNDLMKVIKGDIFKLTTVSFEKPLKNYQKEVEKIFKEIRQYNSQAPIYVLGIYNPFYLYFEDLTEMQEIVNNWNLGTEEVVFNQKNAYFIPINDLLYKGSNGNVAITNENEETSNSQANKNDVLYDEDRFHPNNLGYQIIASTVRDELVRTEKAWLPKQKKEGNE